MACDGNHERGPAVCYQFLPSIYHLADETILFHEVMRGFCHLWLPSLLQLLCQKPCLGWDGVRTTLCQPLPCILPKITVSMREALSALAVASINKVHQYLQRSTKDSCTTSAPQTPSIFTLHPRGITATLYLAEKPQYSHGNSSLNSWF